MNNEITPIKLDGKISTVVVFNDYDVLDNLILLSKELEEIHDDTELIIICNGLNSKTTKQLIDIIDQIPNATLHFIAADVEQDYAKLIGMDNAIGDWVLLADLYDIDKDFWAKLLSGAANGFDLVYEKKKTSISNSISYKHLRKLFFSIYNKVSSLTIDSDATQTRLFSRDATLYILSRRESELILKCSTLGKGFTSTNIERGITKELASNNPNLKPKEVSKGLMKAIKALHKANAFPMRGVVVLAIISAVLNLIYACYTVIIFLYHNDVAPGWATLSLQNSGMFFLLSLMFALVGENLVSIDRAVNYRIKYRILREIRSKKTRTHQLRNILQSKN